MCQKLVKIGVALFAAFGALQAQGQTCSNSTLNGTYFYDLAGAVANGTTLASYAELGKLVANGSGAVSGHSTASVAGSIAAYTLSGTYAVQANCTGTLFLSVNSQPTETITFQIVSGGQSAVVAFSSPGPSRKAGRTEPQPRVSVEMLCLRAVRLHTRGQHRL